MDDDTYGIIFNFVNEAIGPEFKITNKSAEHEAQKPYTYMWWDISAVDSNTTWAPALISFRKGSGNLIVAAGYSSKHKVVVSIADPNAATKIRNAVQYGWDSCPNHDYYKK